MLRAITVTPPVMVGWSFLTVTGGLEGLQISLAYINPPYT